MKTLKELEHLLIEELSLLQREEFEISRDSNDIYFNKFLGNISVYLTSILHEHLFKRDDWNKRRWLDDSLITKIDILKNKYFIWGVTISGLQGTSKQWTDPFHFEIIVYDSSNRFDYTFLFGDKEDESMDYIEYSNNRRYWDFDFYRNKNWTPSERNWDFIINYKNR